MSPTPLVGLVEIPSFFRCPISLSLMQDPVTLASGITYDRSSIETWLDNGNQTCPMTKANLGPNPSLIPNHALRRLIQDWCVVNKTRGVERIPTPTPPADPAIVFGNLSQIANARSEPDAQTGTALRTVVLPLLQHLRRQAKSSDRNKRCIHEAGAVPVLMEFISSLNIDANERYDSNDASYSLVLEECIGLLSVILPLASTGSFQDIDICQAVLFVLVKGSMDARVNSAAILVCLSSHPPFLKGFVSSQQTISGLASLFQESLYPAARKTSLRALFAIYGSSKNGKPLAQHKNLVHALIEILPGAGKATSECVLAILRSVSAWADGRALIKDHSLSLPVLVRSLLVVSDVANELAVCILWHMCSSDEGLVEEVAHLGAAQKLLVMAQISCPPSIKQKCKGLLRVLTSADCARNIMDCSGIKL